MKKIIVLTFALLCAATTFAYTERNILQKQTDMERLKDMLILNQEWVTYPDYVNRKGGTPSWVRPRRRISVVEKSISIISGRW